MMKNMPVSLVGEGHPPCDRLHPIEYRLDSKNAVFIPGGNEEFRAINCRIGTGIN
jgi:hypothetical protein